MSSFIFYIIVVVAFASSAIFTLRFCSPTSTVYILDHPNERSLHVRPVPRGGGLAILIAIIICGAATAVLHHIPHLREITIGMFIVAGVSFLDDRFSVPFFYRLIAHVAATTIILYGGFALHRLEMPGASWQWSATVSAMISALFIIWMVNLYNFMDGMDGLAGGMAVFGFGTFAAMGWIAGHITFSAISMIIAAASAGFLFFNFPPARIFMGDIGSSTLGFLAAVLSLWGARENVFPFWAAVLVFSPFIADATVTLIRRLLQREKVWQAHKTHYYQKLVQTGWGHRRTVLLEYMIMLGCGLSALWSIRATVEMQLVIFMAWVLFYFSYFSWVSRIVRRGN